MAKERTATQNRLIDALPPIERSFPMKVLCLGQLRTGTISLDYGLRLLCFHSYHGKAITDMEQMKRELPLWNGALKLSLSEEDRNGKAKYGREEFDKIVGEYDALLEPAFLYEDLLKAYPDAKVILTTRSSESWLVSLRKTLFVVGSWDWASVVDIDPDVAKPWWEYVCFVMHLICGDSWVGGSEATPKTEKVAIERFEAHNQAVRDLVTDKSQLLEWNPAEGWKPLCEFLEVGLPFVKDFPKANNAEEFVEFHRKWFESLKAQAEGMIMTPVDADGGLDID